MLPERQPVGDKFFGQVIVSAGISQGECLFESEIPDLGIKRGIGPTGARMLQGEPLLTTQERVGSVRPLCRWGSPIDENVGQFSVSRNSHVECTKKREDEGRVQRVFSYSIAPSPACRRYVSSRRAGCGSIEHQ